MVEQGHREDPQKNQGTRGALAGVRANRRDGLALAGAALVPARVSPPGPSRGYTEYEDTSRGDWVTPCRAKGVRQQIDVCGRPWLAARSPHSPPPARPPSGATGWVNFGSERVS